GPPLLRVLPVHDAGCVLLAGAAFLPVIGVLVYHRAVFGGRSWWPLASALVAFNGIFFLGFINFLYGVGLALVFAAGWIRWRERHPLATTASAMLAGVLLFFTHVFGVIFFGLLVGSHELARAWARRDDRAAALRHAVASAAMVGLALLPALGLYVRSTL